MSNEKYCAYIGEEGQQGLAVLDKMFNTTTQEFLLANGLTPSLNVLVLGCGIGTMSIWIAKQLGNDGNLLGIDNNQYQIKACNRLAQNHKLNNCEFKELSAYDIESLNQQFDLVYSRFLLHHLNEPDRVIKSVYDVLKPNGIFICEEGITSFGFAYPPNKAFIEEPESDTLPDKNIGKKLYTKMYQTGFRHLTAKIQHPVLTTQQEKSFLLECLLGSKKTFLASGKNEAEWQKAIKDNQKLANDDESIIGFYASCQVAGTKI